MYSVEQLIQITKGHGIGVNASDQRIVGCSIDSRTLQPGQLFVALKGEHAHGNQFAQKAVDHGAIAILTDQPLNSTIPVIQVADSLLALTQIATYQRSRFKGKVCAVTGTVGKTSVKEALGFITRSMGLRSHISEKSYNNHIGVPLTLANLPADADMAFIEIGMNHPGEILPLAQLAQPHVAMVTSVGPGHIEAFNSVSDIALEKVSICGGLVDGGIAVLPADSEFFSDMQHEVKFNYHRSSVSFGKNGDLAILVSVNVVNPNRMNVTAEVAGIPVDFCLRSANQGWLNNSLAVLAALHVMGVNVAEAAQYFETLPFVQGRGGVHQLTLPQGEITLIDDAYNANPLSMKASLETLSLYPGRRIAVIGDMRELGHHSQPYHRDMGQLCASLKIDRVLTCGTYMEHAFDALSSEQRIAHVSDYTNVWDALAGELNAGDIVLFKASNGVNLHKIVTQLLGCVS